MIVFETYDQRDMSSFRLGRKTLKPEQFSLMQPLSSSLSGASAATHSESYLESLLRRAWTTLAAYMLLLKLRSATLNSLSALTGLLLVTGGFFPVLASLSFLWALVTGIWLVRKAW